MVHRRVAGCRGSWRRSCRSQSYRKSSSRMPCVTDKLDDEGVLGDHVEGHANHRCVSLHKRTRKPHLLQSAGLDGIEVEGTILRHRSFLVAKTRDACQTSKLDNTI